MWTESLRMFYRTCELIADDRRKAGRDDSYHRGKLRQLDAAAADLLKSMKAINKVLDAYSK